MDKKVVYHASSVGGIKRLEPQISSHGKAYVYATDNRALSILFASEKSMKDLDGKISINPQPDGRNIPVFREGFEGSFERVFKGASGYVYTLPIDTFKEGKTGFKAEVVSEQPVKIKEAEFIPDLYEELLKLEREQKVMIVRYNKISKDKSYVEYMNNYIRNTFAQCAGIKKCYEFAKEHYPEIVAEYEERLNSKPKM